MIKNGVIAILLLRRFFLLPLFSYLKFRQVYSRIPET